MSIVDRLRAFAKPPQWRHDSDLVAEAADTIEELSAALDHILSGALSLPRFAEEEAQVVLAKVRGNDPH